MILVIGGAASGKKTYVKNLGYTEQQIADAVIDDRPVLYHLEKLVYESPSDVENLFSELLSKEVVICNEVGAGIIPLERRDRDVREATGRLCIRLAEKAEKVIRLISGIPTIIKE